MNQHRGPAAIQGRDQIRRVEEISAKYDSPNGGLKAIRARNMRGPSHPRDTTHQEGDTT